MKQQTSFVENAPCVTTPKKYTGYFLKEGAKHADQFFNVGYTQDNPLQLRYDMARQFDMGKAIDIEVLKDGSKKFNIYMELGITKNVCFALDGGLINQAIVRELSQALERTINNLCLRSTKK